MASWLTRPAVVGAGVVVAAFALACGTGGLGGVAAFLGGSPPGVALPLVVPAAVAAAAAGDAAFMAAAAVTADLIVPTSRPLLSISLSATYRVAAARTASAASACSRTMANPSATDACFSVEYARRTTRASSAPAASVCTVSVSEMSTAPPPLPPDDDTKSLFDVHAAGTLSTGGGAAPRGCVWICTQNSDSDSDRAFTSSRLRRSKQILYRCCVGDAIMVAPRQNDDLETHTDTTHSRGQPSAVVRVFASVVTVSRSVGGQRLAVSGQRGHRGTEAIIAATVLCVYPWHS